MKGQFRLLALACIICFGLVGAAEGQEASPDNSTSTTSNAQTGKRGSATSPEERLVRSVYEKLALLNRAAHLTNAGGVSAPLDDSLILKFELRDFRVGPIQDLRATRARNSATLPSGEIISVARIVSQMNNGPEYVAYEAEWAPGQYSSGHDPDWSVGDLLNYQWDKYHDIGVYASYEVTVSFKGKTRTYRALALFHNAHKSVETPKPTFWDNVVGLGGVLTDVWNEKRPAADSQSKPPTAVGDSEIAPAAAPLQKESEQGGGQSVSPTESRSTSETQDEDPDTHDSTEHQTGAHGQTVSFKASCNEQPRNEQLCKVDIIYTYTYENGTTTNWFYTHVNRIDVKKQVASGPRGELINCFAARGVATNNCLNPQCNFEAALTISGTTAKMTGGDLWNGELIRTHTCKLPKAPTTSNCTVANFDGGCPFGTYPDGSGMCCSGGACDGGAVVAPVAYSLARAGGDPSPNFMEDGGGDGGGCVCDSWQRMECLEGGGEWLEESCACASPILVDLDGDGFDLTDGAGGVLFDFGGSGPPKLMSWTAAGSDDSWLFLDRNGNGTVDSGQELFGTSTPQPAPPAGEQRNGFAALAVYDRSGNGGNADGRIDARDTIYASLRLWRDVNHNGVSEADELQTLAAADVVGIHLEYRESKRTDEHGNRFLYRAKVDDARGARVGRWAWDVFPVKPR